LLLEKIEKKAAAGLDFKMSGNQLKLSGKAVCSSNQKKAV